MRAIDKYRSENSTDKRDVSYIMERYCVESFGIHTSFSLCGIMCCLNDCKKCWESEAIEKKSRHGETESVCTIGLEMNFKNINVLEEKIEHKDRAFNERKKLKNISRLLEKQRKALY